MISPALSIPALSILAAATTEQLVQVLLVVILAAVAFVGLGAVMLVLRVILPDIGAAADTSLGRLGTRRLLLTGVLPLVGAGLLARGIEMTGSEALALAYLLLIGLPLTIALVVGAMAGLPHLGARVLREGADPTPLARATLGGLVLGLSMVSWALPPLGLLVTILLASWLLGIGFGSLVRAPRPAAPPEPDPPLT